MSMWAPTRRSGWPSLSRSICERTAIQRTSPSLGRTMRYSALYSPRLAAHRADEGLLVLLAVLGWMRRTQSSCVSFQASGGRPWILRYSGGTAVLEPVGEEHLDAADLTDLLHARELGLAVAQARSAAMRFVVSTAVTRTPPMPPGTVSSGTGCSRS